VKLEAVTVRVERLTWWLLSSEFGDATGGRNQVRLEEHLEEVNLEAVFWETGAMGPEIQFIG